MALPKIKYGGIRNEDLYGNEDSSIQQNKFDIDLRSVYSNYNRIYQPIRSLDEDDTGARTQLADFGLGRQSKYDEPVYGMLDQEKFLEHRASNQTSLDKLANGIGKAAVFAGTSFVRNSLGFLDGLLEGNMHNNMTTKLMQYVENWADEVMPLYSGAAERDKSWLGQTIGSMNWWMESLRSVGIMAGAGLAGGMWGRAFGLLSSSAMSSRAAAQQALTSNILTSFISSSGEAGMEANEITKNMIDEQRDLLDARYDRERQNILDTYGRTNEGYQKLDELNNSYQRDLQEIESNADKAGRATYWSNVPILMAENLLFFGKALSRNYNTAARLNGFENPTRVNGTLGRYTGPTSLQKAKKIAGVAKGPLFEGNEEMMQNAIKKGAEMYYTNNSLLHPEATEDEKDTFGNFLNSVTEAVKETYTDPEAYKEGLAGLVIGVTGGVMPRSPYNTRTKKWQSPFTLEGGLYSNIKKYKQWVRETNELANQLNGISSGYDNVLNQSFNRPFGTTEEQQSVENENNISQNEQAESADTESSEEADGIVETTNYYKKFVDKANGLVRTLHYRNAQENALQRGDVFEYKNAEFSELFSHINIFAKAGRLQDLRDMVNTVLNTDDENLVNSIIEETTKEITDQNTGITKKVGPYVEPDGSVILEKAKEKIAKNRDYFVDQIDKYANYIEKVQNQTSGTLSDKQVEELAYMHMALDNMKERTSQISDGIREITDAVRDKYGIEKNKVSAEFQARQKTAEQNFKEDDYSYLSEKDYKKYKEGYINNIPKRDMLEHNLDNLDRALDNLTSSLYDKSNLARNSKKLIDSGVEIADELDKVNKEFGITYDHNVLDMFADVASLVSAQNEYNKKLVEFLDNPENIEKDNSEHRAKKAKEQAEEKIKTSENNFKENISKVQTLSDAHKLITQTLSDMQSVSSEFTMEDLLRGNKDSNVIKEYNKARSYKNALNARVSKELKNRNYSDNTNDIISQAADAVFQQAFESLGKDAKDMIDIDYLSQHVNAAEDILSQDVDNMEINTDILYDMLEQSAKSINNTESTSARNSTSEAQRKPTPTPKQNKVQKQDIIENKVPKNTIITDGSSLYQTTGNTDVPLQQLGTEQSSEETLLPINTQKLPTELTIVDDNFDESTDPSQSIPSLTNTAIVDSKPILLNNSNGYIESSVSEYDWNELRRGRSQSIDNSRVINHIKNAGGFELSRDSEGIQIGKDPVYYIVNASGEFAESPAVFAAVKKGDRLVPIMKILEPGQIGRAGHEQYDDNSRAISKWLLDNYKTDKNFSALNEDRNIFMYNVPFYAVGKKAGTVVFTEADFVNNPLSDFYGEHIREKRGLSKRPRNERFKIISNKSIESAGTNTRGVFLQYQLSDGNIINIPVRPRIYTESLLNDAMANDSKDLTKYSGKVSLKKAINTILNLGKQAQQGKNADEISDIFKKAISDLNRLTYKKNHFLSGSVTVDNRSGELVFKINSINLNDHTSEDNRVRFYLNTDPQFIQSELYGLLCGGEQPFVVNVTRNDVDNFDECSKLVSINTSTLVEHNPQIYIGKHENGTIVPFMYPQQKQAQTNPSNPIAPTNIPTPKNTSTNGRPNNSSLLNNIEAFKDNLMAKLRSLNNGKVLEYKNGDLAITRNNNTYRISVVEQDTTGGENENTSIQYVLQILNKVNGKNKVQSTQVFTDLSYLDSIIPVEAPAHVEESKQSEKKVLNQQQHSDNISTPKVETYTRSDLPQSDNSIFSFGSFGDENLDEQAFGDDKLRQQTTLPTNTRTYDKHKQVLEQEMNWLKEALPQLQDKVEFVDNIRTNGDIKAWGIYKNNSIQVLNNAPEGTIYHEAFHYVFNSVTDNKKRNELLSEIRKVYGKDISDLKAEEALAEEFREYMQTGNTLIGRISQKIKNFFKNLLDFLHITSNNSRIIDTYFRSIKNGEFASEVNINSYKKSTDSVKQKLLNEGLTESEIENLSNEELDYAERCL